MTKSEIFALQLLKHNFKTFRATQTVARARPRTDIGPEIPKNIDETGAVSKKSRTGPKNENLGPMWTD